MRFVFRVVRVVAFLLIACAAAHAQQARRVQVKQRALFAAAADGFVGAGSAVEVRGGPPWSTSELAATEGGRFLRRFGGFLYVVNSQSGSITRLSLNGALVQTIDLGPGSLPQDIRVTASEVAYVTRRDDPRLLRLDPTTGSGNDVADLGLLAGANEVPMLKTLIADGDRLFVQVDLRGPLGASRGVLGVVDATTGDIVDVDAQAAGIQGIPLMGAPPQLRMQILGRTLFVSTTGNRLDNRGGIEMVDLDTLSSIGFALTEKQIGGADLGGFVMLSADEGYAVAHTDIVPSTHLRHFTISGGLTPGPDLLTLLGDAVEALAYDARREYLYVPTGFASFGAPRGVLVLDTCSNRLIAEGLIRTPARVHDILLGR